MQSFDRTPPEAGLEKDPWTTDLDSRRSEHSAIVRSSGVNKIQVTFRGNTEHRQSYTLKKRMSFWIIGNLVFGGVIGVAIDLLNPGACVWPSDGRWHINLEPKTPAPQKPEL